MSAPRLAIQVAKWDEKQAYKDRDPKWIKLYRSLIRKRAWRSMSADACRLLIDIWGLAAELPRGSGGVVDMTADDLAWELRSDPDSVASGLAELEEWGFITYVTPADAKSLLSHNVQNGTGLYDSVPQSRVREEKRRDREEADGDAPAIVGWDALSEIERKALTGLYGLGEGDGTDEGVWGDVTDRTERKRMVETALLRVQSEGAPNPLRGPFFRRVLSRVVTETEGEPW